MKERIQKVLAAAGVASRRTIEQMVEEGRVAINGTIRRTLPILIDPDRDKVDVDGERLQLSVKHDEPRIYLLLHKPKDVYCTNTAQGEQTRAIDLLPPNLPGRVYPVGRLDADSKGLLLMTNDGELTNRLTHPRFGIAKTYRAVIDGYITGEALESLQQGIWLGDPKSGQGFKTGRSRIKVVNRTRQKSVLEITIKEGRNRQIRRMLAKIGHKVRELTRVQMGPLSIKGLPLGHVRKLTPAEVKALHKATEPVEQPKAVAEKRLKKPAPKAKKN